MTAPSIPTNDNRRAFLVHELRVVWLRLKDAQHDVEAVAFALTDGMINPDEAVGLLHGCGLLGALGARAEEQI
jgi:hypothetical protein